MAEVGQYVETLRTPNGKFAKLTDLVMFIMRIELDQATNIDQRLALRLVREALESINDRN